MRNMQRAGGSIAQSRLPQSIQPKLTATQGHLMHLAPGLSDRPDHSKIAHRRSGCALAFFEKNNPFALARGEVCVSQAKDPRAYNGDVRSV
jgi:hypothetical protein